MDVNVHQKTTNKMPLGLTPMPKALVNRTLFIFGIHLKTACFTFTTIEFTVANKPTATW